MVGVLAGSRGSLPADDCVKATEVISASGTPAQVWALARDGSGHATHVDAVDTGGAPTTGRFIQPDPEGLPTSCAPQVNQLVSRSPGIFFFPILKPRPKNLWVKPGSGSLPSE